MSAGWVGVDPGAKESGVVLRVDDWCAHYTVVTREPGVPMGAYIREVVDAVRAFLDQIVPDGDMDHVAVEGLNPPIPQMGVTNVRGLLGTAQVLGGVLAVWPSAVVVPPGGHGSGPLAAYPDVLRPTRGQSKGFDVLRHCRSAFDVAGAAPITRLFEGATTDG